VDRAVHRLLDLLLLVLPVALVVAALGGWLLARRALRPIDQMVGAAELIGPRDLRDRIAVPATRDEVAHLGRTLNAMLDRMQRGVEEQQRVVADSSHELRTPLAAMRTELDVSLHTDDLPANARAVLESARDEVDRMSAIVDDLLILASADERSLRPVRAPVDLARIAGDAAHALTWLAGSRRVELAVEGPPAPAHADPDQLGHVVRNLVDNAIKFSPEGGRVTVRTFVDDHSVGVRVEDHGDGIPEQMRDRVFDRFLRVDGSRSRSSGGSGLGLAIARTLVVANGGAIAVAPHEPRGSVFTVELPRTD
jgi:signal transduction histidine kinase